MQVNKVPTHQAIVIGQGGFSSNFEYSEPRTIKKSLDLVQADSLGTKGRKALQQALSDRIDFEDELVSTEDIDLKVCDLIEKRVPSSAQAYMLVYIRERDMERITQQPKLSEIPRPLVELFDHENEQVAALERELKVHEDLGDVYLISPEIVHSVWPQDADGIRSLPEDFNRDRDSDYLADQSQHLLIKMKTNAVV